MRMPRSLVSMVLALAVLAGQWLAASHDPDHGPAPGSAHVCAICVYAHGAGNGALPVLPQLALAVGHAAPELSAVAVTRAAVVRAHPIRGPPPLV